MSKSETKTVLVVEDEPDVRTFLTRLLELEGYQVLSAGDGEAALGVFEHAAPDVVLLDIMLPGIDGYTVCQRISEFSPVPIIMVTAKGKEDEKVRGFDAGADDYITKPFSAKELVARIKAVLRRHELTVGHSEPAYMIDNLRIDFARNKVTQGGKEIELTATEYRLLSYLVRNAARILTADQLLERVWGEEYVGESHILQVNIARLRKKLNDEPENPRYVLTRHGIGYTMVKKE